MYSLNTSTCKFICVVKKYNTHCWFHTNKQIAYSRNLSWVETFANWRKLNFRNYNFRELWETTITCPLIMTPSYSMKISVVKTFVNWTETVKFAKVFTRERFPPYSIPLHTLPLMLQNFNNYELVAKTQQSYFTNKATKTVTVHTTKSYHNLNPM